MATTSNRQKRFLVTGSTDGIGRLAARRLAMFTMALSERLESDDVTVNCLHPGSLLGTKMVRRAFGRPLGSAASGADVQVYLATAPELAGVTGVYFDRKTRSRAHEQAYDRGSRKHLWRQSLLLTGRSHRLLAAAMIAISKGVLRLD